MIKTSGGGGWPRSSTVTVWPWLHVSGFAVGEGHQPPSLARDRAAADDRNPCERPWRKIRLLPPSELRGCNNAAKSAARAWRGRGDVVGSLSLLDGSEPDEPLSQRLIADRLAGAGTILPAPTRHRMLGLQPDR